MIVRSILLQPVHLGAHVTDEVALRCVLNFIQRTQRALGVDSPDNFAVSRCEIVVSLRLVQPFKPYVPAATDPLRSLRHPLTIACTPAVAEGCPIPYVRLIQPMPRLIVNMVKNAMSARPLKRELEAPCKHLGSFVSFPHRSSKGFSILTALRSRSS
jgi:hypothetical protein